MILLISRRRFGLFGDLRNGRLKTCGSGREQKNKKKSKKTVTTSHPHFHSCVAHLLLTNTHSHTHARHEMMYSSLSSSSVLAMTNSTTTTKTTPFASTRRVKAAAQKWAKNTTAAPSWKRSNPLTTTTRARANAFEMGGGGLKRASNFRLNAVDTEAPSSSSSSTKLKRRSGRLIYRSCQSYRNLSCQMRLLPLPLLRLRLLRNNKTPSRKSRDSLRKPWKIPSRKTFKRTSSERNIPPLYRRDSCSF